MAVSCRRYATAITSSPARDIDQDSFGAQRVQHSAINQTTCPLAARRCNHQNIDLIGKRLDRLNIAIGYVCLRLAVMVENLHIEGGCAPCDFHADMAEPENTERATADAARNRHAAMRRPAAVAHVAVRRLHQCWVVFECNGMYWYV